MTIAVIQSTGYVPINFGTVVPSLSGVVAGNTLIADVTYFNSGGGVGVPTLADSSGQTWLASTADQQPYPPNPAGIARYYLPAANVGTHTVTFTGDGAGAFLGASMIEVSGLLSVASQDASSHNGVATGATTSGNTGTTGATTQASEFLICALAGNGAGLTNMGISDPPSGFTSLAVSQDSTDDFGFEQCYKILTTTGTQSCTWSWTSGGLDQYSALATTFKASTSTAPTFVANAGVWSNFGTSVASSTYTPASTSNSLILFSVIASASNSGITVTGTESSPFNKINPPGDFFDALGNVDDIFWCPLLTSGGQTFSINCAVAAQIFGWAYEVSHVGGVTNGSSKNIAVGATGTGAIQGNAVSVPTGSSLWAFCCNLSVTDAISSPGGINIDAGEGYCVTAYNGAGSSITPTFTGTQAASNGYFILQMILGPAAPTAAFYGRRPHRSYFFAPYPR